MLFSYFRGRMAESVGIRKHTRSGSKCGEDEGRESKKQRTVHFSVSRIFFLLICQRKLFISLV